MFRLCFENHRKDGLVWAIDVDGKWTLAATVRVNVPVQTSYAPKATLPEPAACLWTAAPVSLVITGSTVTVNPA